MKSVSVISTKEIDSGLIATRRVKGKKTFPVDFWQEEPSPPYSPVLCEAAIMINRFSPSRLTGNAGDSTM